MKSLPPAVPRARQRTAFTLVELLVSMVVGILLIVFLFQLFNATAGAWKSGEEQNDTYREARAALQIMVRDISQTAAPLPPNAYATPTPTPSSSPAHSAAPVLVIDSYQGATLDPQPQPGDEINEELYCLTNIPNSGSSTLCAVGYFCMWMPDLVPANDPQYAQKYASAPRAYALVRQFLGSGSVTTPGLFECFYAARTHSPLTFADVYTRARPPLIPSPTAVPPQAVGTQLASFIWDLQFRTRSTLQTKSVPSAYPAQAPYNDGYPGVLPAYVEIRFKALSSTAARQLEGNTSVQRTDWNDQSTNPTLYQRIILPGTRQFVARVPISGGNASPTTP